MLTFNHIPSFVAGDASNKVVVVVVGWGGGGDGCVVGSSDQPWSSHQWQSAAAAGPGYSGRCLALQPLLQYCS